MTDDATYGLLVATSSSLAEEQLRRWSAEAQVKELEQRVAELELEVAKLNELIDEMEAGEDV